MDDEEYQCYRNGFRLLIDIRLSECMITVENRLKSGLISLL